MKKYYILDTNVLLYDLRSIYAFADNDIVIPIIAIEELDKFKKDLNDIGRNARQISRIIDGFRAQGPLYKGVELENGGTLKVFIPSANTINLLPKELIMEKADNQILSVALELKKNGNQPVCLVTKDTNLRIKADALGISAHDYESNKIEVSELYSGYKTLTVPKEIIDRAYTEGQVKIEDTQFYPNEFVLLLSAENPKHSALARYDKQKDACLMLNIPHEGIWGIHPKNVEQRFLFDILLNDSIKLITIVGKAGTGKTLLSIAAGLRKTADDGEYTRLLISRPVFPLGKDIGFLPGDIEEKLLPWMQPIFDNLELISDMKRKQKGEIFFYKELIRQGILELEPLTYIRGRSIPNQYIIIDEAQNLTPHEIKTIITRVGDNTKIVLTGDPYQIDNPYIDSSSNGLSYLVERFKDEEISAHITLSKGERSQLAEQAANLL